MAYQQFYLTDETEAILRETISAYQYIDDTSPLSSPFTEKNLFSKIIRNIKRGFVALAENITGTTLYAENTLGEMRALPVEVRWMLTDLHKKGLIEAWNYSHLTPGQPIIHSLNIRPTGLTLPSGKTVHMSGSTGNGTGSTLAEAALPALGEFIERTLCCDWSWRKDIVYGSYKDLHAQGIPVVHPKRFQFFSDHQLQHGEYFEQNQYSEDSEMKWLRTKHFTNGKTVYIPASTAYMFYALDNPDEPSFWHVNSNGTAAYSSYGEAVYRALCELIERDAFLRAWYHKKTCQKVSLDSLKENLPEVASYIEDIQKSGIKIHILDITSDIDIPTFCVVQIDTNGGSGISVSAATRTNAKEALTGLLSEILKFSHGAVKRNQSDKTRLRVDDAGKGGVVRILEDRLVLWSYEEMEKEIAWFVQGEEVSYEEIEKKYQQQSLLKTLAEKITYLKRKLSEKDIDVFVTNMTGPLAKRYGLYVVRTLSPQLIPMFFDEKRKYLGLERLCNEEHGEKTLNDVPHPFV